MAKIPKYQYKNKRKVIPSEDRARTPIKPYLDSNEKYEIEEGINEYERAMDQSN